MAGAIGADSFNLYLAVPSVSNNECGRNLALRKGYDGKCHYLMQYINEKTEGTSSVLEASETNGHIENTYSEDKNETNNNTDVSDDTEKEVDDAESMEIENLKYAFLIIPYYMSYSIQY